jgi:two-component system sensor histidine kinase AlgZ
LGKFSLPVGSTLAFAVVIFVTLAVSFIAETVVPGGGDVVVRMLGHAIIAGIITALVLRYFYVQQRLRLQEQAELQSRIQALQSRIRPHFLFNSMNIIASLIAIDPDTAESVVEDLSELFRASLNDAGNQVPISEELDLCERYIRIEALRLGERLKLVWDVDELSPATRIPLLTLQPLVENAIYHGIQPLPEGGTIEISVKDDDDYVLIRMVNPVPPPSQVSETQGNRMALQNIRSRLSVLYGAKASLQTDAIADTFVTQLRFPKMPQAV